MKAICIGPVVVTDYADGRVRIENRASGELVDLPADDPATYRARILAHIAAAEPVAWGDATGGDLARAWAAFQGVRHG
jgi:hypothetical protein